MPVEATAFYNEIKRYKDDQTIDRLNALYVAFTRAERELIVTINSRSKEPGELTAAGLLWPEVIAIQAPEDNETPVVEIGRPTQPQQEDTTESDDSLIKISSYVTRKRKNMWANTKAANLSDSGEPI